MRCPPALRPGDTIGIAAPASCFPREAFDAGVRWLSEQGFRVVFDEALFSREHYLAGSSTRRLAELQGLLSDPGVRAIFCARGGYGVMHLLPHLDLSPLVEHPKIFVGYSDLTPLLNLIPERVGLVAFHGPLVAGIHKTRPASLEQMLSMLRRPDDLPPPIGGEGVVTLRGGKARARLCGGNLSLIAATMGTPYEVDTRGRILCLEDVGERPYRVDRLLAQLALGGKLEAAAGVAIGELLDCREPNGNGRPLEEIFRHYFDHLRIPVVYGLPFGHGAANDTLPIGAGAELDADRGILQVTTPVVR